MAQTTREMLDQLDDFFTNKDNDEHEKQKLWAVLTGLRGPDIEELQYMKPASTAVIRGLAFPKMLASAKESLFAGVLFANGAEFAHQSEKATEKRIKYYESDSADSWHFRTHIRSALEALGIDEW